MLFKQKQFVESLVAKRTMEGWKMFKVFHGHVGEQTLLNGVSHWTNLAFIRKMQRGEKARLIHGSLASLLMKFEDVFTASTNFLVAK